MAASLTRTRRRPSPPAPKAEVVSMDTLRRRREDRAQAKAIALYECAVTLARMEHPGLLALVDEAFGPDWLEDRIRSASEPTRRKPSAR